MIEVWLLPRPSLAETLQTLLGGAEITQEPSGKPVVEGLHFNVSHSGELALVAVCEDAPVGVDLEAARTVRRGERIAQRLCSPRELEYLTAAPDFDSAFLRLWVRKEAVAKADGGGIGWLLSSRVDVLDPYVAHGGWLVHDLTLGVDGYAAALAWPACSDAQSGRRTVARID
ncbi:MAG: 4'-phosphopantetheinyl transferase superfamily protein [Solirubrobacterales bacterium]|nr:4'-phosphopantetheinyl transferase superfamily protein [Solirubrobacterales bacterium]